MESISAFASICDKLFIKDVVARIVQSEKLSPYIIDRIMSRLDYDMPPVFNNQGGILEFPYLDQLDSSAGPAALISNQNLSSAGMILR
jgi:hypothetical protein